MSLIDEVYAKYPTNSLSKFKRIANKYSSTDDEDKKYLKAKSFTINIFNH